MASRWLRRVTYSVQWDVTMRNQVECEFDDDCALGGNLKLKLVMKDDDSVCDRSKIM